MAEPKGVLDYEGDPQPWRIVVAYQEVSFELFEKGAKVRVETGVVDGPFGDVLEEDKARVDVAPRNFICDQPFFVFIWRDKAAWPYFSARLDGEAVFQAMELSGKR